MATWVEGDPKAPFSIATTPRCRGGRYSLYCWVLSKDVSSIIFKVFGMTRPGIEPRSPRPLANSQLARPMRWFLSKVGNRSQGRPEGSFSKATTPRCKGGRYSFPWISSLYPWYLPNIAECQARTYQVPFLKYLVWHDLGLNLGLPDHWRTLYPQSQYQVNRV